MTTINDLATVSSVSSADKLPLWSNANGVTRALPVSVLDARYITQDQINLLAISPTPEIFAAGDGVAPNTFLPGTTAGLLLANLYGTGDNIEVFFDGTFQGSDQWALTGYSLLFISPIPVGTSKVYVKGGAARITNGVSPGSITDASVATTSRLYNRINDTISVKDFPFLAAGNGTTDDSAAINAAEVYAASVGKALYFPAGIYLLAVNNSINKLSNVPWYGEGRNISVITGAAGAWGNSLVRGVGNLTNCSISNMGFDFSRANFLAFLRNVFFDSFSYSEIAHCNFYQQAIGFETDGGIYFSVHDCFFTQPTVYGTTINQSIWVSNHYSTPDSFKITNNVAINSGLQFNGNNAFISNNYVVGYGYGGGIGCEFNTYNYTISNNQCISGTGIDANGVPVDGIECWANHSVIVGNMVLGNAGVGISVGGSGTTCTGNVCMDNGQYSGPGFVPRYRAGIILRYVSNTVNANSSNVSNNVCIDNGGGTQLWGITDDGAGCAGSLISDNLCIGASGTAIALGGARYDFKGPKLQLTATGSAGFTLSAGTSGGGNSGLALSGAQLGDKVTISTNQNTQGLIGSAWVVSPSAVAWTFFNPTGAAITVPNYTVNLTVEKPLNYANY